MESLGIVACGDPASALERDRAFVEDERRSALSLRAPLALCFLVPALVDASFRSDPVRDELAAGFLPAFAAAEEDDDEEDLEVFAGDFKSVSFRELLSSW